MVERQEVKPLDFWDYVEDKLLRNTTLEPERIQEWVGQMKEFADKIEKDPTFWPEGISDFKRSLLKNVASELERRGKIKGEYVP